MTSAASTLSHQARKPSFDYGRAFSRNLGLVTQPEQVRLRQSCVAVLGAGGIGSSVATTLARMGVGALRLADPDLFDFANFNRQGAAFVSTVGKPKAEATAALVRDINPQLQLTICNDGLNDSNIDRLLEDVDVVVDAVDFFSLGARKILHRACRAKGIPVVFSAPLGMSTTLHVFTPDSMTFEAYFDLREGMSEVDTLVAFLVGLSPRMSHRPYMDMRHANVAERYGPSLAPAVMLGCGVLGVEVLRILLQRPNLRPTPYYLQFDAYRQRLYRGRLRWGNRGPIQRLKRWVAKRILTREVAGL